MEVTSSGLTPFALVTIVFGVVTSVTVLVALVGILIDRDAARHERKGEQ
jgi:hypothetical protein